MESGNDRINSERIGIQERLQDTKKGQFYSRKKINGFKGHF
jgi:hypothetical protein